MEKAAIDPHAGKEVMAENEGQKEVTILACFASDVGGMASQVLGVRLPPPETVVGLAAQPRGNREGAVEQAPEALQALQEVESEGLGRGAGVLLAAAGEFGGVEMSGEAHESS